MEQYIVTGMSCAACSARVEKAVSSVDNVTSCSVNLLTNSMTVEGSASPEVVIQAVEMAGYGAHLKGGRCNTKQKEEKSSGVLPRLLVSCVFLAVLMYFSMGYTMWHFPLPDFMVQNPVSVGLTQLILTVIIMIINQKFFINGSKALWMRNPNMDTLVSLGSFASFGYSVYALYAMSGAQSGGDHAKAVSYLHELYFESAAMILTLITVGKLLEGRAKGKTTSALKGLMKLTPKTATVIKDGKEITIAIENVQKDDVFAVRPGEQIPVDGVVLEGQSAVNEAVLTGESIPSDKEEGSDVWAGTMNESGFLKCRAVRVGEDTTLSQIIRMVSDASATKAPIAKIADRVSGVFVPVVLGIALVTLIVWLILGERAGFAIARAISVLVISCPCALGLATPVAIMVGTGLGAKNNILFKTAVSLEELGKVRTVVLDKTGTITEGNPTVTDIYPVSDVSEDELLSLAASLERGSEHPIAKAILKKAENMDIPEVSDFTALSGNGITAKLDGAVLWGGKTEFIKTKVNADKVAEKKVHEFAKEGKTPVLFAKDDTLLGIVAVADVIKEDSPRAVAELKKLGMRVVMLTGDNPLTANAIGKNAGVDEIIAEVMPDGKEEVIRSLQKDGKVAMVGDGINDAPALTRADTGIAIGAGTDIAIDAADVVLAGSTLSDAVSAIRLSRATVRNIKQNLFWAFIYNIIGIPLAAGLWYKIWGITLNPMFGAAAMSLSSFCVVSNALRLNLAKIKNGENTVQKIMKIEGMMCTHCEAQVKKCLKNLGASKVYVSHKEGKAIFTISRDITDKRLKNAIENEGYKVIKIS